MDYKCQPLLVLRRKSPRESIEKEISLSGDNRKVFWRKKLIIKKGQRIFRKNNNSIKS